MKNVQCEMSNLSYTQRSEGLRVTYVVDHPKSNMCNKLEYFYDCSYSVYIV